MSYSTVVLLIWAEPCLFLFTFVLFWAQRQKYNTNRTKFDYGKSVDGVLGVWNRLLQYGRRRRIHCVMADPYLNVATLSHPQNVQIYSISWRDNWLMLRYRARRDNDDGKSGSTAAQLSAKERLKNLARTDHIDCSKKITRLCLVKVYHNE